MYIVGAQALGTVNANSTVRNLPKPPQGDKTAWISPPTEFPFSKPVFQESVYGAEAAKTTPMECAENYRFCWLVIELKTKWKTKKRTYTRHEEAQIRIYKDPCT